MNADELIELIKRGPTETLVSALAGLTEAQRRKLSKSVVHLRKQISGEAAEVFKKYVAQAATGEIDTRVSLESMSPLIAQRGDKAQRLRLALIGVGPWGEAGRIRVRHMRSSWKPEDAESENLFRVMSDRKPDWLQKWVEAELDERVLVDWSFVRRLVRAGLCERPQTENYILQMFSRLHSHGKTRKELLLEDSELLNWEIWQLFEQAPVRGTILWDFEPSHANSWSGALRDLSAEGKLDRQRLLSASLSALLRNLEARNTPWFATFHEVLEPSDEERQALQPKYLQLLSHPVPKVMGFALAALAGLAKAKRLDPSEFLEAVPAVFRSPSKTQPVAALRILARLAATAPGHEQKLVQAVMAAFIHSAPEVQQAALGILEKVNAPTVIASMLPAQMDQLAASVQERARQLLKTVEPDSATDLPADNEAPVADLLTEARQTPSPWRELAGIDVLLDAFEGTGELKAVSFDPMKVPRLYPQNRLAPVQTLDELIERLTIAVEGLTDALEFELLLDGLSRLCDQRPDDFDARIAPLASRLSSLTETRFAGWSPFNMSLLGLRGPLFKLILRWTDQLVSTISQEESTLLQFLEGRLYFVSYRIGKRRAAPLLGCPTHRPGWIDCEEMRRRLEWYQEKGQEPSVPDFVQGMLRLAPDGRADTLSRSAGLQGRMGIAFRYALGGPLEDASLAPPLLVSAGRARAPFVELPELHPFADTLGAGASYPARYSWRLKSAAEATTKNRPWAKPPDAPQVLFSEEPARGPFESIRNMPTVLLHDWQINHSLGWPPHSWVATIWPADLQPFFAAGVSIPHSDYMTADLLRQRAAFLEPLFDPEVPFSEMAQVLLAICLGQKEPQVTGLAVDALIELIRDGRCAGPELGAVLARMLPAGEIKCNRLGKHLETVAQASLLHAHVCAEVVQTACAALTEIPRDFHCLLGPLLEWLTSLQEPIREPLPSLLQKAQSGKTGSLAKRLLLLSGSPEKRGQVLLEALRGRVQRAERWRRQAPAKSPS
ncbi:MAG: DUF6493 family protein [Gemmataceae bacterium]